MTLFEQQLNYEPSQNKTYFSRRQVSIDMSIAPATYQKGIVLTINSIANVPC